MTYRTRNLTIAVAIGTAAILLTRGAASAGHPHSSGLVIHSGGAAWSLPATTSLVNARYGGYYAPSQRSTTFFRWGQPTYTTYGQSYGSSYSASPTFGRSYSAPPTYGRYPHRPYYHRSHTPSSHHYPSPRSRHHGERRRYSDSDEGTTIIIRIR